MKPQQYFAAGLLLLGVYWTPVRPALVLVQGNSMSPSFASGSIVVGTSAFTSVKRGDVVVSETPMGTCIKRVALIAGDHYRQYLQGGDWITPLGVGGIRRFDKVKFPYREMIVPSGAVFLVGDNQVDSVDSRSYGPVPVESIRFKVQTAPPHGSFGFSGEKLANRESVERDA